MAATKTKTAPDSEAGATSAKAKCVMEYVEQVSKNRTKLLRAADEVCAAIGLNLTQDQLNAKRFTMAQDERNLFAALGWDIDAISRNIGRMRRVAGLQQAAGTSAERTQAAEKLTAAKSALEKTGPKLEADIIELQQQLQKLQSNATAAQADVDRRAEAVKKLRDAVPDDVLAEWNQCKRNVTARYAEELKELNRLADQLGTHKKQSEIASELAEQYKAATGPAEREKLKVELCKAQVAAQGSPDATVHVWPPELAEQRKKLDAERKAELEAMGADLDVYSR